MNFKLSAFLQFYYNSKLFQPNSHLKKFHFISEYVIFEEADLSPLGLNQSPDSSEIHTEDKPYKKEGKKMSLHRKSKPSRRTTSLLDLFFSSSLGMFCCQLSSCLLKETSLLIFLFIFNSTRNLQNILLNPFHLNLFSYFHTSCMFANVWTCLFLNWKHVLFWDFSLSPHSWIFNFRSYVLFGIMLKCFFFFFFNSAMFIIIFIFNLIFI